MIILMAGSILIAALVGWALTRTVEPAPADAAAPTEAPSAPTPEPGTTAAPPAAAQPASPDAGVARIRPEELKPLVDRGAVTIVDVRDSVSYSNGHIPGAIHIPFARVEGELKYLPKDKPIVAYCT